MFGSLNHRLAEYYCHSTTFLSYINTSICHKNEYYQSSTYQLVIILISIQRIHFNLVFTFTDYISALNCNCKMKDIFEALSPTVLFQIKL